MNLLIDIGNTRLKWAIANGLDIESGIPINNAELNRETLVLNWQGFQAPNRIAIACVGVHRLLELVASIANELWPSISISIAQSEAENFGIRNAYQEPAKLGMDRWLSMIAGYHLYRKALCIVGCGTAITVDCVDSTGQHLGGLICPGLRLMRSALTTGTANLKPVVTEHPKGLATFTDAAISNGTLAAAGGLVEQVLKNYPEDFQLLLTGGDADLVAAQIDRKVIIQPDLVLIGLAVMLQRP